MHLAAKILAALSHREEVRNIIEQHGYLDAAVLQTFLAIPYPAVLIEILQLLNNCCRNEVLFEQLATETVLKPLVRNANRTDDPGVILQVSRLWHRFSLSPRMLKALRDEAAVEAIFAIIRKGPPTAQEMAIQAIYHLAADTEIKRAVVRRGMLECFCELAESGPNSVQPHAAWLIASLVVRGDGRDLMFQRNTLEVLTRLLQAANTKVVAQAAWALSLLPRLDDVVVRLVGVGCVPLLCAALHAKDPALQAQGARTIGALAWSRRFREEAVEANAMTLLLALLAKEAVPDVHAGVAMAIREFVQEDEGNAITCLQQGVAEGLVRLLASKSKDVRGAALSAIVPLLSVLREARRLLEAGVVRSILREGQDAETFAPDSDMQLSLARAMRLLASNDAAKAEFRDAGGLGALLQLARSDEPTVQEEVAWAIGALASDPDTETRLAEAGAVDVLNEYLLAASEAVRRRAQWSLGVLTPDCLKYAEAVRERREGDGNSKKTSTPGLLPSPLPGTQQAANLASAGMLQPADEQEGGSSSSSSSSLSDRGDSRPTTVDASNPEEKHVGFNEENGMKSPEAADMTAPQQQQMMAPEIAKPKPSQALNKFKAVSQLQILANKLGKSPTASAKLSSGLPPGQGDRPRPKGKTAKRGAEVPSGYQRALAAQAAVKEVREMISFMKENNTNAEVPPESKGDADETSGAGGGAGRTAATLGKALLM